jgi:hypothetical protein
VIAQARVVTIGTGRLGRVARFGRAVLVVAEGDPAGAAALVALTRHAGGSTASITDQVAALLGNASAGQYPSCCAITDEGDELSVLVHGGVEITAHQPSGPVTLRGDVPPGWQTHRVKTGDYVSVRLDGAPYEPVDALADLEAGVVRADGVVIVRALADSMPAAPAAPVSAERPAPPAAAPAPAAPTPPPPPEPEPRGPSVVVNLREEAPVPAAAPLPPSHVAEPAPAASDHAHGDLVEGVTCSRGHFNDPRARYCHVCGIAMLQSSVIITRGARPPLGVLVFAGGSTAALDRSLVVGREPQSHPDVAGGRANPLPILDPGQSVSRIHAEVRLEGWDVVLVDRGSTNGTFVWVALTQQWQRLAPEQPIRLDPGTTLAFGKVTCVFESAHQQY